MTEKMHPPANDNEQRAPLAGQGGTPVLDVPTAAMDRASRRDKWFFERHPHRRYRLRAVFPGEFPVPHGALSQDDCTIVAHVAPAWRMRFVCRVPPFLRLDTDAHCEWLLDEAGFDPAMIESARAFAKGRHNA